MKRKSRMTDDGRSRGGPAKKTGSRKRSPRGQWHPELDAAMPRSEELEALLDRLLRDPKEIRAVIAALSLLLPAPLVHPRIRQQEEANTLFEIQVWADALSCSDEEVRLLATAFPPPNLPVQLPPREEALSALRGLIAEGSALAALLTGVMHWHGQGLPRDRMAAEELLAQAAAAGLETRLLVPGGDGDGKNNGTGGCAAPDKPGTPDAPDAPGTPDAPKSPGSAGQSECAAESAPEAVLCDIWPLAALCAIRLADLLDRGVIDLDDSARETLVLGLERQGAHGSWQALEAALDVMLTPAGMDLFSDHDDLEKKLLENMARTGCLPARVRLAEVLADAVGSFDRPPDRDRAEQLLEEAWEEGDADAGAMLALMQLEDLEEESRNGNGRDEEDEEGEKRERQRLRDLLGEAAMQGSGLACDALGEYGCLEARDREELEGALMWMDLAVVRGRCDRTLALAQAMAAQSFPRNIHARREDGLALLRLGANLGHAPFLAELAPWRLCGLDGEPADVPAGLAMLERALDAGSLTAAARLAEIRLLGLHGVAADPAAGIGLAARLADIVGIERGQALLDLAALGFFGEEAAALSPVSPQRVCRDLERAGPCSGQPEVLLRLHALLLPERTAELVQQARQADADDPDGPCDPDRPHERDEPDWPDAPDCEDGPRPGAEFRPRWPYPSDSGELAFALLDIFLAALYGADVAALRVFAACLERQPDTPALEELAGKFLKGLTAGGRGTCADLRRLAMRAVTDTARIAADPSDF